MRGGTSGARQSRAPGNQSRTEEAPRGDGSGETAPPAASPTAMQSGWFFQVPPCLVPRPAPAPAAPAGPGGWLRDTRTRRGRSCELAEGRRGALSGPRTLKSRSRKHATVELQLRTREGGTQHPRGPLQSFLALVETGLLPLSGDASCATCAATVVASTLSSQEARRRRPQTPKTLPPPPLAVRASSASGKPHLQLPLTCVLKGSQICTWSGLLA